MCFKNRGFPLILYLFLPIGYGFKGETFGFADIFKHNSKKEVLLRTSVEKIPPSNRSASTEVMM
jgi:hypothetical protein